MLRGEKVQQLERRRSGGGEESQGRASRVPQRLKKAKCIQSRVTILLLWLNPLLEHHLPFRPLHFAFIPEEVGKTGGRSEWQVEEPHVGIQMLIWKEVRRARLGQRWAFSPSR